MQIKIKIVDYEDNLWFEFAGLKFDTLNAFWEFDCKELRVVRNGAVIAIGRVHEARGEPVFDDYGTGDTVRLRGSSLRAEEFRIFDHLELDVSDGFNLANRLTESCQFLSTVIASMPVGQTMVMSEVREKITTELEREAPSETPTQVLRFRRGR